MVLLFSLVHILCLALLVWSADAFSSSSSSSTAVCPDPLLQVRLHKRDVCSALSLTATHRRGLLRGVVDTDVDSSTLVGFMPRPLIRRGRGPSMVGRKRLDVGISSEDANEKGVPVLLPC
jgi:hypothetical protein